MFPGWNNARKKAAEPKFIAHGVKSREADGHKPCDGRRMGAHVGLVNAFESDSVGCDGGGADECDRTCRHCSSDGDAPEQVERFASVVMRCM